MGGSHVRPIVKEAETKALARGPQVIVVEVDGQSGRLY